MGTRKEELESNIKFCLFWIYFNIFVVPGTLCEVQPTRPALTGLVTSFCALGNLQGFTSPRFLRLHTVSIKINYCHSPTQPYLKFRLTNYLVGPTYHQWNFQGTSWKPRKLIFGMQPFFDLTRKTTLKKKWKTTSTKRRLKKMEEFLKKN